MERWRILHKEKDYTVIDNGIFRDSDLSLAERGLLCSILALPDGWDFSVKGMTGTFHDGRDSVYATVNRLIEHGYCKREGMTDKKTGRFLGYEYTFFEVKNGLGCASAPFTAFPDTDLPDTDSPYTENPTQIKYLSNKVLKESNTKKKDISISKEKFNFLNSLIGIGVSREAAEDWLQVRKTKRATNTRIAFERVAREIAKSGRSADECIRFSVEHSYSGFEAGWLPVGERGDIEDLDDKIRRLNDGTYTV